MRHTSWRVLTHPALFAAAGVAAFAAAPVVAGWMGMAPGGGPALALRYATGIWMWLSLAWLAARFCDLLLHRLAIVARGGLPYPRLLTDLARAALFAAAFVTILIFVFDQPATGLIAVSSVLIAVVGFALRNVISDLFSGIALGIDNPYRIGDWIETTQGSAGKVSEITWRITRLTDRNGFAIIVPNGLIAAQRLINYGDGARDYRTSLRIALDPGLPPERAKRLLLSGALDAARHIPGLSPDVLVTDYADGAANYLVRFRVPDFGREAACRDAVASRVLNALQCAGQSVFRPGPAVTVAPVACSPREALLSCVDLFHGFDATERAELAAKMRARDVEAGQMVVRQGDHGDVLLILAEGILDVEVLRDGRETVHDRLAPGEVFGEMSFLTGQERSATVSAATESVVYEIHRRDLDPVLKRRPEIAEGLAAVMASRQSRNARNREQKAEMPAARDDLLARLRLLFGLASPEGEYRPRMK